MKFVAEPAPRRVLIPEMIEAVYLPLDFVERIDEYAPYQDVAPGVTRHWDGRDASPKKIPAIKAFRAATGCGLIQAKRTVEFFIEKGFTWTTVTHE